VLLSSCGVEPGSAAVDVARAPVVGGMLETRYPAVGYLMVGPRADELYGPHCGATLIAPNLAITAAHCVHDDGPKFGVHIGDEERAARAIEHRGYERFVGHDLAALVLSEPITSIEPAVVTDVAEGHYRFIGYGRTTPGGYDVMTGYTDERKSGAQDVTGFDDLQIFVTGVRAGLCWGDSGGPLMDEDGGVQVYGVLADFDGRFTCRSGNSMIFTRLGAESQFLRAVALCAAHRSPRACVDEWQAGFVAADGGACATYCAECGVRDCQTHCLDEGVPCPVQLELVEQELPAPEGCATSPELGVALLALALLRRPFSRTTTGS
jgi:hypothetical protein